MSWKGAGFNDTRPTDRLPMEAPVLLPMAMSRKMNVSSGVPPALPPGAIRLSRWAGLSLAIPLLVIGSMTTARADQPAASSKTNSGFLIQNAAGYLETVVALPSGGLAHYKRLGGTWVPAEARFPALPGPVDAVSLIQSSFSESKGGPGNLELLVRAGDRVITYWLPDTLTTGWLDASSVR
jgi:hypothetical protein